MRVLVLNTSDLHGGAAVAAYRSVMGLRQVGVDAQMLVKNRQSNLDFIHAPFQASAWGRWRDFGYFVAERLSFLPHERDKSVRFAFSPANFGPDYSQLPQVQAADVLHLHWVNQGFLSLENLGKLAALGKPIFLHMHDMWTFSGGCHYAGDCLGYEKECGNCPMLKKPNPKDFSHKIWQRKHKLFSKIKFELFSCSAWLAQRAEQSSLLQGKRIHVLPNALNTEIFKPLEASMRRKARIEAGLDPDKPCLFFIAMNLSDPRKGFVHLLAALKHLEQIWPNWQDKVQLLLAGKASEELLAQLPIKPHYLGFLRGEQALAQAYNLADVFAMPSLEDNLPNTIMESLACGTPVVAFRAAGIPEMITHGENGYLAQEAQVEDFARGLRQLLESEQPEALREAARQKAERDYALAIQGQALLSHYKRVLGI